LEAQGFSLEAQGLDLEAQGFSLEAQGLDLEAQGFSLEAQGLDLDAQGLDLEAQGLDLEAQGFAAGLVVVVLGEVVEGVVVAHPVMAVTLSKEQAANVAR
jgi:hypothetical protein